MNKAEFVSGIQSDAFQDCTMVSETMTQVELEKAYDEYREGFGDRSPMKSDNTLARQGFVNELFLQEKEYWKRENELQVDGGDAPSDHSELLKDTKARVEKFKLRIRSEREVPVKTVPVVVASTLPVADVDTIPSHELNDMIN
jgi:hypothetical protein